MDQKETCDGEADCRVDLHSDDEPLSIRFALRVRDALHRVAVHIPHLPDLWSKKKGKKLFFVSDSIVTGKLLFGWGRGGGGGVIVPIFKLCKVLAFYDLSVLKILFKFLKNFFFPFCVATVSSVLDL